MLPHNAATFEARTKPLVRTLSTFAGSRTRVEPSFLSFSSLA
jgi:hypothetical protein